MTEESFCRQCGTKMNVNDRFCTECGTPVLSQKPFVADPTATKPITPPVRGPDEKFCSQCGEKILALAEICPQCGVRQMQPPRGVRPRMASVENRDWIVVIILSIVTLGVYLVYWIVTTKNEMVNMGADIPTAWFLIIPLANLYFAWKYAMGVEFISNRSTEGILVFILAIVFFPAVIYLTQTELNRHAVAFQSQYST